MNSILTFSALQEHLASADIRTVIDSLNTIAAVTPAARLIQSALELSAKVLTEDKSQLAAQLIGRLNPHRDNPEIGAFLSTITPPVGTLQAVDTGYSTHIAARMSEHPIEIKIGLPPFYIYSYEELPDGTLLLDTMGGLWRGKLGDPAGFQQVSKERSLVEIPAHILEAHGGHARGIRKLRDGRTLSWSGDFTLRLWDAQIQPLQVLVGHTKGVRGAIELSSGQIISWSNDTTLRFWSSEGEALSEMVGHQKMIIGAIEVSGGRILSWSRDWTLRLWASDGAQLAVMVGHTAWVESVTELPDGRFLSWSLGEIVLRVWRSDGQFDGIFEWPFSYIRVVQVFSDGRIICAGYDKTVILTLSMLSPLPAAAHPAIVQGITGLPDGRFLSWTYGHDLTMWDANGQKLGILTGHTLQIYGAMVVDDGQILSWCGRYGETDLRLWDSQGNALQKVERDYSLNMYALKPPIGVKNNRFTFSNGNSVSWNSYLFVRVNEIVLSDPAGKTLKILVGRSNLPTDLHQDQILDLIEYVEDVKFLNDRLIVWSHTGGYIFDLHGDVVARFQKRETSRLRLALLSDELFVLHPQRNNTDICVYDLTGTHVKEFKAHNAWHIYANIIKNRCIVTWADDGAVKVWDAQTFEQTHAYYMDYPVKACAVLSESPLRLAIGDNSGRIAVVSV